jgi:hypothetical protein
MHNQQPTRDEEVRPKREGGNPRQCNVGGSRCLESGLLVILRGGSDISHSANSGDMQRNVDHSEPPI